MWQPTEPPDNDTCSVAAEGAAAYHQSDEFRKLLLADVEVLLQQHHARFTEHLDRVAARQHELLHQLTTRAPAPLLLPARQSARARRSHAARQSSVPRSSMAAAAHLETIDESESGFSSEATGTGSQATASAGGQSATPSYTSGLTQEYGSDRPMLVRSYTEWNNERLMMARDVSQCRPSMMPKQNSGPKKKRQKPLLQRLVHSPKFEAIACGLIVSNSIFIGVEVQYMASLELRKPPFAFEIISLLYTVLFTVELLLRFVAGPISFFCSATYLWNLLDFAIVAVSLVELALSAMQGAGGANQLTYVRIIRMARTVRIFRIMRVLKDFASLRILLYCVLSTLRSLIWTLLLLAIIMYIFGIMFTQAATDHILRSPGDDEVRLYWGALWRSSYTLFKAVTGGVSWQDVSTPLGRVHGIMETIFICFISFTYFAVLNVVTGVFCQSAIESANHDKDMVVQAQMANKQMYKEQLEDVFKSIDQDNTGVVTFGMFEEALLNEDTQLKVYLDSMGITPDDAWNLFRLLDTDESDDIEMEEFVAACLRLRGSARAVDSHLLMYESRWTMRKVTEVQRCVNDLFEAITGRPQQRLTRMSMGSLASSRASHAEGRSSFAWQHHDQDHHHRLSSFSSVGSEAGIGRISVEATDAFRIGRGTPQSPEKTKQTGALQSALRRQHSWEHEKPVGRQQSWEREKPARSQHSSEHELVGRLHSEDAFHKDLAKPPTPAVVQTGPDEYDI